MAKRRLTGGEIALARSVFGDSVDYGAVWLHDKRILPPGMQHRHQAVANGNHISFPRTAYSPDFAAEVDAKKQSVFIHEMTHVWQHQNRVCNTAWEATKETLKHKFNYSKAYFHKLDPKKDLTDYGFEQQAAIVQDYFLLTRHAHDASYKNRRLEKPEGLKERYEAVLSNFLKNPKYPRKDSTKKPGPKAPIP